MRENAADEVEAKRQLLQHQSDSDLEADEDAAHPHISLNMTDKSVQNGGGQHTPTQPPNKRLLFYAGGIFVCYFYFGILQEKITRSKYGESGEMFRATMSLVLIQCIVNAVFARILLATLFKNDGRDTTRTSYYSWCAFTYLTAMVSSNYALQYLNYPTQVVGKSCKPIPVMILGVLFGRKVYSLQKYFFVLMITLGVGIFMFKDGKGGGNSSFGYGEVLLLLSLTMDGLTGAIQERMKSEHGTRSGYMMLKMNYWSVIYLTTVVALTGEIWGFLEFIGRYPWVVWDIISFSALSALGQLFIFLLIADYGPLPCSIVTTTRKFFTVLFSVIWFGNSLSDRQWVGTGLVFTGLALDTFCAKSKKSATH